MNATSSRSHTILSIYVETQIEKEDGRQLDGNFGGRLRRKLMLVDLAGSERIRRSASQGARLAEAKSINSSLSALGNVIAALADLNGAMTVGHSHTHIPYRGSKLTKLLQDSLGRSASTALIATVGPAARNHGETLSTLQFAHRCMSVKGMQQQQGESTSNVDYIFECVGLREELSFLEVELSRQQQISAAQVRVYDTAIRQLYAELALTRRIAAGAKAEFPQHFEMGQESFDFNKLGVLIDHLSAAAVSVPLVKDSRNAAEAQKWAVLVEEDASQHWMQALAGLEDAGSRTSHRDCALEHSTALGTAKAGPSHSSRMGGRVRTAHIDKDYPDDIAIRSIEVIRMQKEDLKKRSNALSSLLPHTSALDPDDDPFLRSRLLPSKPERTAVQKCGHTPIITYASSSEAFASHDRCQVHSKAMSPQRYSNSHSSARSKSPQLGVDLECRNVRPDCGLPVSDLSEGKEVDGVEACDLVEQIRSLSASQLALLNPAMREQVMAIRRLAESDAHADADRSDSPRDDRDKMNAGAEWSSKSSDRPLYWQHRYRNYSVVECDYLSERD